MPRLAKVSQDPAQSYEPKLGTTLSEWLFALPGDHRSTSSSSSGTAVRQLRASAIMITDTTPSSAGGDGPLPASSAAAAAAAAVACPSLLDALAAPRAYDTPQEAGATRRSLLRKQPVRRARSGAGAPQRWRPDRPRRRSCYAVTLRVKRVARRATARPGKELQPRAIRPSGAATHRSTAARRPRLIGSPRTGDVGQLRLLAILTILRTVV